MNKKYEPSIGVVIVNYNGVSFISKCIDSVLSSNYLDFEVVLVDNASTDGSWKLVNQKYNKHHKVKLIRSKRQLYFTGGYNLGCARSTKDRLVLLNSDTVVDKNWLHEMVLTAKNDSNTIVQPKVLKYSNKQIIDNVGGNYNLWGLGNCQGRGEIDIGQYDRDRLIDYSVGTVFLIDKGFFLELGGLDEWYKYYYEDVDLCLRAKKYGGRCIYSHKAMVSHIGSLTSRKYLQDDELLFHVRKNRMETILKNFSGCRRIARLSTLMLMNLGLIALDLLTLRPKRMTLTIRSMMAVIERHIYSKRHSASRHSDD